MDLLTTRPFEDDHPHEECAVFGIYGTADASITTALDFTVVTSGSEASGIVSFDGKSFHARRGFGHVGENFGCSGIINYLGGHVAIGHNRYSTSSKSDACWKFSLFHLNWHLAALLYNGNLTNAARLQASLVETGAISVIQTGIMHLVAHSHQTTVTDRLLTRCANGGCLFACLRCQ